MKRATMRSVSKLALVSVWLAIGCGATRVSLAPALPTTPTSVAGGESLAVARRAEAMPDSIGYSTITVFAIPASPIGFSDADAAERIMYALRDTLRGAGYKAVMATEPPQGPLLTCRIKEMRFKNYTWLSPMIQTWGRISLTLALTTPEGMRWEKDYEGRYRHNGVSGSFDDAVNGALGEILAQAAEDFMTQEFRNALHSAVE